MALTAEDWLGTFPVFPQVPLGSLACAAAAARSRAARAVLSCAGAYVAGADRSNECPAGSVRIETEAACRTAAAAAGKTVPSAFVETDPYAPRGCYYASMNTSVYFNFAYFNPHPVGFGDTTYRLLCAVTSGAPPPPPLPVRTRAYTCAGSGTVHVQRRVRELHAHVRDRACVVAVRRCTGYARRTVPGLADQSVVAGCLTERYSAVLSRYSRGTLCHSWAAHRMRWAVHGRVGHT
jgi:hypothetical protein